MGVLFTRTVEGPAVLGLWKISESVEELLAQVSLSDEEKELYATFRTETRRKQWLAYRRLIKELISPQRYPVHYDESGKPYLAGSDRHISVTHTDDFAGVIISREVRVGMDIEKIRDRITRVKDKFMNEEELMTVMEDRALETMTLVWCAKESLYKLYGVRNLDFRKNIRIYCPEPGKDNFSGEIAFNNHISSFSLQKEMYGDLMLVWATEPEGD